MLAALFLAAALALTGCSGADSTASSDGGGNAESEAGLRDQAGAAGGDANSGKAADTPARAHHVGVRPETRLAKAAGLPLGEYGGLLTDLSMRVRGHENNAQCLPPAATAWRSST